MHLFLIRHAETVDNVASLYAGTRDSALTSHGVLQTRWLAAHLSKLVPASSTYILASDLQRAVRTAEAVRDARGKDGLVTQLVELREKHFGTGEGMKFGGDAHIGAETGEEMALRADRFLDQHLLPLLSSAPVDAAIFVIAHGLILGTLFRQLCEKFSPGCISLSPEAQRSAPPHASSSAAPIRPAWSNTGYLEATVSRTTTEPTWSDLKLHVKSVNSVQHLTGLRKTRGGIGSARFDDKQKTMDSFFRPATSKKRKLADAAEDSPNES